MPSEDSSEDGHNERFDCAEIFAFPNRSDTRIVKTILVNAVNLKLLILGLICD